MARYSWGLPQPKVDPITGRPLRKVRKPVGSGLKSQVLARSKGRCERCGKNVIGLGLKPRYHHKDGNPSHNTVSNVVLLCNDCHDKVHVYRTKTTYDPILGNSSKKVLIAKRIKKKGRKKKSTKKRSFNYEPFINPITGMKERRKKNSFGWGF
jgi:5-methylcytosine-specific restriction endonuclease McrA